MFTTQEIIGDIVYVSFADKERYKDIGLDLQSGHFKILGYDNIGLWVEHPYLLENKATNNANNKLYIKLCFICFFSDLCSLLIQAISSSLYGNMLRYII